MAKRLKTCAAIDHRAFIHIFGDIQEKAMQHPKREGLVNRDQHDN